MAKELPYFKFKVSEWSDGDITLEDYETQGLFINLCSYYWSREGELTLANAKRRYRDCNATAFDNLINSGIIKVDENEIVSISFLDEQLEERENLSNKNRENAAKRWGKNATAMRPHSEKNAIGMQYREEKKREEKIDPHTIDSTVDYDELLKYFNEKTGRNESRVTASVKGNVKKRLFELVGTGMDLDTAKSKIGLAIQKASTDNWLKENNVLTLIWITQEDNFYKWLDADIKPKRTKANP